MPTTVGQNFKRIRERLGLTQEQVYRQLGYRRPANVSILENSQKLPKPDRILRMARVLRCAPAELMRDVMTPHEQLRAMTSADASVPDFPSAAAHKHRRASTSR